VKGGGLSLRDRVKAYVSSKLAGKQKLKKLPIVGVETQLSI
jgi:hypothetical protein